MLSATAMRGLVEGPLASVLEESVETRSALLAFTRDAYRHDNGFVKIVLRDPRLGPRRVRIHVWPETSPGRGNIHNHCWDFTSYVISGALKYEEFEESPDGFDSMHFRYPPSGGLDYVLQELGPARLSMVEAGSWSAGDVYQLAAETLHWTQAVHGLGATTVLVADGHRRQMADVYLEGHSLPQRFGSDTIDPDAVRTSVERIILTLREQ